MRYTERWDELLGRIYDAALDPTLWQAVIEHATEFLEARHGKMAVLDLPSREELRVLLHRLDPSSQDRWFAEFVEQDPWTQIVRELPPDFVVAGSAVVPDAVLRRSAIYEEFLRPDGIGDILSAALGRGPKGFCHVSFFRDDLFERRHVRMLSRIAPHLRRALRTQGQLFQVNQRSTALEAAVDQLQVGIFLLDRTGQLLFCNRRGEAMLQEGDGLSVRRSRLQLSHRDEARELDGAIRAATAAGTRKAPMASASLSAARPSRRRPLSLLVVPVRRRDEAQRPHLPAPLWNRAAVLVTVSDPEYRVEPPSEHLGRILGLTAAEARLAAGLAGRLSLEEYAERAGITMNTVRWTLKRVLDKARCRRQGDLVHLIATSVVGVVQAPPEP